MQHLLTVTLIFLFAFEVNAQKVSDYDLLTQNSNVLKSLVNRLDSKVVTRDKRLAKARAISEAQWDYLSDNFLHVYVGDGNLERFGSGYLLSENGWFVTAAHIIDAKNTIWDRSYIVRKGVSYPLRFYVVDREHDIALAKVSMRGDSIINDVRFNDPERKGRVYVLSQIGKNIAILTGFVFRDSFPSTNVVPYGVIKDVFVFNAYTDDFGGFSGSPVFNRYGELIGVSGFGNFTITDGEDSRNTPEDASLDDALTLPSGGSKIKYLRPLVIRTMNQMVEEYNNKKPLDHLR